MESIIKTFATPIPLNLEKLEIELIANPVITTFMGVLPHQGEIQIRFEDTVTALEIAEAAGIVANHDGVPGTASDDQAFFSRRKKMRKLIDIAEYAGLPKLITVGYRTTLDNEINGAVDSGEMGILLAKINDDRGNPSHPYYAFLNTETTPGKDVGDFFVDYVAAL